MNDSSLSRRLGKVAGCVQGWLEAIVNRANPILVKETRQALKSRQFVLTFLVVLIACWIASFAVVAIAGPEVYYGAEGSTMLWVYCLILAFPLLVIVPYSAYRSIAVEQEDNTYDLLSITALSSSRIITGKLGSAMVQMAVYLSAVSPCIGFTFLLRGVDALTVAVLLGYFVLASLALSIMALLAGTASRARYAQVFMSVLLVLGLILVYRLAFSLIGVYIDESYSFLRDFEYWVVNLGMLTFYLTTFALVHAAASAQIAFRSENRSTPLRKIMLLQFACFVGWMALPVFYGGLNTIRQTILVVGLISGIYWYFMGMFLTSEWPHLSRRVQRSLPKTRLGQMFFTWFNPGPGTGYLFCVANLTTVLGTGLIVTWFVAPTTTIFISNDVLMILFLLMGWCYIVALLGAGRLFIGLMRRFTFVSLTAGFLLHIILLLFACGIPQILAYMSPTLRFGASYSLLHITNPIWTLMTLVERGLGAFDVFAATMMVGAAALIVFLLNVRSVANELQLQRRALPIRVAQEEEQLHPAPVAKPASPWESGATE